MRRVTLTKHYAIYVDLTCEETPRPFYVGVGNQRRVNNPRRNEVHGRIVQKHGHRRDVVHETDDLSLALLIEKELVAAFRTYAHGGEGWWGANLTRGGETSPMKDPHVASRVSLAKTGHITSDETKRKIGIAVRQTHADPEVWRKMSDASKRRRHSPETRAKMSRSQRNRPQISDETRRKLHEAAVRRELLRRESQAVLAADTGVINSTSDVKR